MSRSAQESFEYLQLAIIKPVLICPQMCAIKSYRSLESWVSSHRFCLSICIVRRRWQVRTDWAHCSREGSSRTLPLLENSWVSAGAEWETCKWIWESTPHPDKATTLYNNHLAIRQLIGVLLPMFCWFYMTNCLLRFLNGAVSHLTTLSAPLLPIVTTSPLTVVSRAVIFGGFYPV